MAYSYNGRIRFSECDENGILTIPGLVNYMQDCCTFQSEDAGQGMLEIKKRDRAWILNSWQIVVERYPRFAEEICVTTMPYYLKGFLGMRNFIIETMDGERLAYANSSWTYFNIKDRVPVRMTDEDKFGYDLDPKLDMEYASRKIPMPEDSVPMEHFRVQPHHLDTNHHVNNSQYITMAMEYLPGRPEIREIRVYYRKQAFLGDEICPRVSMEKDKIFVLLANTEDEPYAIVELFPCTGRDSKR